MARQKTTPVHYYIGFADDVCKAAKLCYREIRSRHIRSFSDIPKEKFILHTVGKWWNVGQMVAVRYKIYLRFPKIEIIKHL